MIVLGEIITMVSWFFLVIHHALYQIPVGYFTYLGAYLFTISCCFGLFAFSVRSIFTKNMHRVSHRFIAGLCFLTMVCVVVAIGANRIPEEVATNNADVPLPTTQLATSQETFSIDDVGLHNNVEDCWVIIDAGVYNASDAAAMYPDIYVCGTDVTEKYRTVVAEGVSERMQKKQVGVLGFSPKEVSGHSTKKDCWLIIDGMVFDATEESMLHPAAFNCGTDASKNYHKNHGETISERMMRYMIGYVAIDDGGIPKQEADGAEVPLSPYAEKYREYWDPQNLMVVVEKDAEKVLFIDGTTHELVGRIHGVGYQPHTSVYTHDARFMFIIARDGWLTKIDLKTLEPVKSVKVGINSRGTALTDSGKYLVVGNYEPGNAVVIDPETLEVLKSIPTKGSLNGAEVESRVGAVVEDGELVILALKDLNSVWVIDTSKPDFPITHQFSDIGNNQTPLHDAFLTPDGRFYLVASMGSNTVWVLDTDTWTPVGEIPAGNTPHTGPGATWGPYVYVPSLGEGLIFVIDSRTWKEAARIKTSGPGLFVRSYAKDPSYPYVWADTAFGEHHDEIYVIDAASHTIKETLIPVPGESSWHPEFTYDGKFVYVVSQTGNEVTIYDAHNLQVVKRIESLTPSAISNVGLRIEEPGL